MTGTRLVSRPVYGLITDRTVSCHEGNVLLHVLLHALLCQPGEGAVVVVDRGASRTDSIRLSEAVAWPPVRFFWGPGMRQVRAGRRR